MPSDYHISLISVQKSHFLYLICYHYYHLFFHLLFISYHRVPYNAFLQQSILDFRAIREEGKSNEIELLCQTPILSFVSARRCAKIFLYRNQSLIVDLYQTKEPLKCNKAQNQMNPNQSSSLFRGPESVLECSKSSFNRILPKQKNNTVLAKS